MAEFVEQRMQEMVPEIIEMERLGILTDKELKKVLEKRRDFEYRTSKQRKEKQDFLGYTLYDIELLKTISSRRNELLIPKKLSKLDIPISVRVMRRLRLMSRIWPSHPDIWHLRITFSKSINFVDEVSSTFVERIQLEGNNEDIWIAWAQWEIEGRKNFHKARTILLSRAPLYHPNSLKIMKEYFRLELLYIEHLKKRAEDTNVEGLEEISSENREKVLSCAVPETIFKNAQEQFNTTELYLEFFNIAHEFPFAHKLRNEIFTTLIEKFPNDKVVWQLKAKIMMDEMADLLPSLEELKGDPTSEEKADKKLTPREKLQNLILLYDKALSFIGPPFLEVFLQDFFSVLHQVWASDKMSKQVFTKILSILKDNSAHLTSDQFLIWYQVALHMKYPKKKLKSILKEALLRHSDCRAIQKRCLPFAKMLFTSRQEKLSYVEGLSGSSGVDICLELLRKLETKPKLQKKLEQKLCFHHDASLAKELRLKRLEALQDLKLSRRHYDSYKTTPPFCLAFHAAMLEKELRRDGVTVGRIRQVFDVAVDQFGSEEPALWLCYIEFERALDNARRVSDLRQEADRLLKAPHKVQLVDLRFAVEASLNKATKASRGVVSSAPADGEAEAATAKKHRFWQRSTLPPLLEEDLAITFSGDEARTSFFDAIAALGSENREEPRLPKKVALKTWEGILGLILKEDVSLRVLKVDLSDIGLEKEAQAAVQQLEQDFWKRNKNRGPPLSMSLQSSLPKEAGKTSASAEIQRILDSSETLKPEFLERKEVAPYYLHKRTLKAIRKKEREKTSGSGWFDMKAPEVTEEVERDLNVLQMRSVIDPHRHYKRNDLKERPKFFQVGEVVDSPVDFFSSRIPKKQRKRTFAETIMHDQEVLRYQKRKYAEVVEFQEAKRKRLLLAKRSVASRRGKWSRQGPK